MREEGKSDEKNRKKDERLNKDEILEGEEELIYEVILNVKRQL